MNLYVSYGRLELNFSHLNHNNLMHFNQIQNNIEQNQTFNFEFNQQNYTHNTMSKLKVRKRQCVLHGHMEIRNTTMCIIHKSNMLNCSCVVSMYNKIYRMNRYVTSFQCMRIAFSHHITKIVYSIAHSHSHSLSHVHKVRETHREINVE